MSNSDGDERKNDGGEGPVEKGNEPKRAGRVRFWPLMFFLLVYGAATAPFYWPRLKQQIAIVLADDVVQDLGTVQKISFIGGLWIGTQIETETLTLLVVRRASLQKGTPLQSRDNFFSRRICVAGTERCWDAVGE